METRSDVQFGHYQLPAQGRLSDPVPSCLMTVNDITYVQSLVTADIS